MSNIFYHDLETPDLKNIFFQKNKNLIKKISKTIIISGGARNGNHLVWSLLDGNKEIPFLPGEDTFLSQLFWKSFNDIKKFKNNFLSDKFNYFMKLNGVSYDKWKRIHQKKINNKKWAGGYYSISAPLKEFPDHDQKINYKGYSNYIKKNLKNNFNFYDFFSLYLKAFSILSKKSNNKLKYKYIYAQSGLRRELLYLLKNNANIKCIVPIRKFETFYFSTTKTFFNSIKINKKYLNDAWERWFHKTNDYLYLKKKYPKKIILVKFEDLENIDTREKAMKNVCKKLNIKFQKINLIPTHFKKAVLPNSSFTTLYRKKNISYFKNIKNILNKKLIFPKGKIPKNYFKIYNLIEKNFY